MKYLSDHDPSFVDTSSSPSLSLKRPMDQTNIGKSGWYFEYNREPLFVTTLAPCYGTDSSRYMWPTADTIDSCFILFQAEYGFRLILQINYLTYRSVGDW
jgi:hypothetical protein